MTVSICTLAHGRAAHLANVVRALDMQTTVPDELVIAVMQADAYDLPETRFPIRQIMIGADGIPLAAARNAAARAAQGEQLIFLDVDCIPAPSLVADYLAQLGAVDAVLMGEVLYLPSGATAEGLDFARFAALGVKHSERAGPPIEALGDCTDYRCFWSLNFAMRRATFLALGGFDERYVGYGGEDTDFGRVAMTAGIPIHWVRGARVYHQYHPHHMPPVHHVDSVIANAARFRDKWGHFTMEHWLKAFTLMGLITLREGEHVRLRTVSEEDLALTRQQVDQPYASTSVVLAQLEARAPAIAAA
ncbi:GT2 family glycosyltransferase [Sphingomonas sp. PP-CE-3A-406]|uniref:glycosyltransferase family 2 protein n=1 Tax=Sphingomonas sp. PP-CE-3A-406 TaxID=2135659 RepID=UPI000EF8B240|nr:galactosyltransferase-related protein [Sphingomonas sp. PP-CE-3A-406]RMB55560.1 GT2 family glycosyltransferase [Sphingomonas sp. PP-CE-3A-406]